MKPALRLRKGDPLSIRSAARAAAKAAHWELAQWDEFAATFDACFSPDALPEEMALALAVVEERFEVTKVEGFTLAAPATRGTE